MAHAPRRARVLSLFVTAVVARHGACAAQRSARGPQGERPVTGGQRSARGPQGERAPPARFSRAQPSAQCARPAGRATRHGRPAQCARPAGRATRQRTPRRPLPHAQSARQRQAGAGAPGPRLPETRRACEQQGPPPPKVSTPGRIRTCDQWLRRPSLYPAELRALTRPL